MQSVCKKASEEVPTYLSCKKKNVCIERLTGYHKNMPHWMKLCNAGSSQWLAEMSISLEKERTSSDECVAVAMRQTSSLSFASSIWNFCLGAVFCQHTGVLLYLTTATRRLQSNVQCHHLHREVVRGDVCSEAVQAVATTEPPDYSEIVARLLPRQSVPLNSPWKDIQLWPQPWKGPCLTTSWFIQPSGRLRHGN